MKLEMLVLAFIGEFGPKLRDDDLAARTMFAVKLRALADEITQIERERCATILAETLKGEQAYVYLPSVEAALRQIRMETGAQAEEAGRKLYREVTGE